MTHGRARALTDRLRPHVRHRFDDGNESWWSAASPSRTGRWRRARAAATPVGQLRRADELAQVLDRLAVLLEAGDRLPAAIALVTATGRGAVADELHVVAQALGAGRPLAAALRAWARAAGCSSVGVLAADVRRCTSSDEVVAALRHHAAAHRGVAHHWRMEVLRRRVRIMWLLAVVAAGVAAVLMVT
ncbi:MAG: hypothetical protein KY460_00065 [Actinobacteria bacterium]|nr:hypothetical protein [Actinomycetota bacterium]